jgi:hypothetical protein
MPTEADKQRTLEAIQALPDSLTMDEAIERLCFIAKIEEGLRQSRVTVPGVSLAARGRNLPDGRGSVTCCNY